MLLIDLCSKCFYYKYYFFSITFYVNIHVPVIQFFFKFFKAFIYIKDNMNICFFFRLK